MSLKKVSKAWTKCCSPRFNLLDKTQKLQIKILLELLSEALAWIFIQRQKKSHCK